MGEGGAKGLKSPGESEVGGGGGAGTAAILSGKLGE